MVFWKPSLITSESLYTHLREPSKYTTESRYNNSESHLNTQQRPSHYNSNNGLDPNTNTELNLNPLTLTQTPNSNTNSKYNPNPSSNLKN